jgi:hypothetical protein
MLFQRDDSHPLSAYGLRNTVSTSRSADPRRRSGLRNLASSAIVTVVSNRRPFITKQSSVTGAVCIFIFAGIALGQNERPNLAGIWKATRISRGPVSESMLEIRQTESTLAMRQLLQSPATTEWSIYPTDGKVFKKKGRNRVENTGRWQKNILVLESTGPGNAPWRRSTMRQTLLTSASGRTMRIEFHELSDKNSVHDYDVEFERVK